MTRHGFADHRRPFDPWGAAGVHTDPFEGSAEGTGVVNAGDLVVLSFTRYVVPPCVLPGSQCTTAWA